LTLNQDSSTVTAFDGTTEVTINGQAIAKANNQTFAATVTDINSKMRSAGNDIYAELVGTNQIKLTSESGASITIHEDDNSGIAADVINAVEVIDGRTVDETGSTTGNNLTDDDAGNANAGAGVLTFSGNITYTSTKGPIVFGHAEDGTTALRTTAQTALDVLGVKLSNTHLSSASSTSVGVDLSSATKASAAITAIDNALSTVNTMRGDLGALQNRLEHTMNSLSETVENHSASRSRAMDADFASESAALAKAQVLAQASTAMLAQANAAPQLALQLLQ
jgi:flagellin